MVDLQTAATHVIETHRREYYGISWWPESDFPVLSHSGVVNETLVDLASYANSIKGQLSFGEKQTAPFLSEPHQILCAPNGWAIITNTGRNCITLYDPSTQFYRDIRVNDLQWDRLNRGERNGEHFNSVFLKNNYLYVLAHGHEKESYVLQFSYPDCELINKKVARKCSGLHNIFVDDDGHMISCNTEVGGLIEIQSNELIWQCGQAFYSRGLAVTKDVITMGDSQIGTRETRVNSKSGLWLIDRKTLKSIDYIFLGNYGNVHEVRILDESDEAHHGNVFKNITALEKKNYYQEVRQTKMKEYHLWLENNALFSQFNYCVSGLEINELGWFYPRAGDFCLALSKQSPKNDFILTAEYQFSISDKKPHQTLSLIIGYKGPLDSNMIAILLNSHLERTSLELWRHDNCAWNKEKILIEPFKKQDRSEICKIEDRLEKQGQLRVTKIGNELEIICDDLKPIKLEFNDEALSGEVGVRCLGSQFKNFTVSPLVLTSQEEKLNDDAGLMLEIPG